MICRLVLERYWLFRRPLFTFTESVKTLCYRKQFAGQHSFQNALFFRYSTSKMSWPWNPDQRSLKVIATDTDRSATYDFLLTIHSNHESISYRFQSKIARFPPPRVYLKPRWMGFIGIKYRRKWSKTRMTGYQMVKTLFYDWFRQLDTISACEKQTSRHLTIAKTAITQRRAGEKKIYWPTA